MAMARYRRIYNRSIHRPISRGYVSIMNSWKLFIKYTFFCLTGATVLVIFWLILSYTFAFLLAAIEDTGVISEAKGSIKDNNPYLIGQSEDGLVLLYKYDRCYIAVHGMSNGIDISCKY